MSRRYPVRNPHVTQLLPFCGDYRDMTKTKNMSETLQWLRAERFIVSKDHTQVGWLSGSQVRCLRCGDNYGARLYHVNVYPYRQTCHVCGTTIVESAGAGWCELFEKGAR